MLGSYAFPVLVKTFWYTNVVRVSKGPKFSNPDDKSPAEKATFLAVKR